MARGTDKRTLEMPFTESKKPKKSLACTERRTADSRPKDWQPEDARHCSASCAHTPAQEGSASAFLLVCHSGKDVPGALDETCSRSNTWKWQPHIISNNSAFQATVHATLQLLSDSSSILPKIIKLKFVLWDFLKFGSLISSVIWLPHTACLHSQMSLLNCNFT